MIDYEEMYERTEEELEDAKCDRTYLLFAMASMIAVAGYFYGKHAGFRECVKLISKFNK